MPGTALTRIQGYAHVARKYGLEEAIFLDSIVHWFRLNRANQRNYHDGRWWTYNSMAAFAETFPWWSAKQLRRIAASCKEQGALLTGNYNAEQRDRTIWYSPSDALLTLYGEIVPESERADSPDPICPNGQMHLPETGAPFAQKGEPLPCNNHVGTNNTPYSPPLEDSPAEENPKRTRRTKAGPYKPDWFDAFWAKYPRKDNKQAAKKAWDKLRPDRATCVRMAAALELDKQSRQWTKDDGDYIPYPATWLNQRRWEDEGVDLSLLPAASDSGGWVDDPEVIK